MTQISAADNHSIITKPGRWRLAYNDRPLAEGSDRGFRYSGRFGQTRRLPTEGLLEQGDIRQVVLGWQATDESWHLGLILSPMLADTRGSRWCEIVHWPDPDISVFQDLAQVTGQELAQAIGVPFYVIPPQPVSKPAPVRDLPKLPLSFGDWEMMMLPPERPRMVKKANEGRRYIIKRTQSYTFRHLGRMGWYAMWSVIYLVLSLATIFGDIALPTTGTLLPEPAILPYIGLFISLGLLVYAIVQFGLIIFTIDRFIIDGDRDAISGWRGKTRSWVVPKAEIQSVYISEMVKKRDQAPATEYGELNLHLGGGKFHFMLSQEDPEDNADTPQPDLIFPRTTGIRELDREVVHTDLQAAGIYIAEALGNVPVWYDLRVK